MRLPFAEFVDRYKPIAFDHVATPKHNLRTCVQIMKSVDATGYILGKTKIFLKYWTVAFLDNQLAHQEQRVSEG